MLILAWLYLGTPHVLSCHFVLAQLFFRSFGAMSVRWQYFAASGCLFIVELVRLTSRVGIGMAVPGYESSSTWSLECTGLLRQES